MLKQSMLSPAIFFETTLDKESFQGSPMCINTMKVLQYLANNGGVQLTKSGNFYRKFVEWAAEDFQWPGYEPEELYRLNKVLNEPDFLPLFMMHGVLMNARLIRHYKGRAFITKA